MDETEIKRQQKVAGDYQDTIKKCQNESIAKDAENERLQAENADLRCLITSSDQVRANACKSIEQLQAEAAAMSQAIQSFCAYCDRSELMLRCTGCVLDAAKDSTTAGAAMLDRLHKQAKVIEASQELWKMFNKSTVTGEFWTACRVLFKQLAEMDGDK